MGGVNRELGSPEGASEEDHSLLLDPGTAPEDVTCRKQAIGGSRCSVCR